MRAPVKAGSPVTQSNVTGEYGNHRYWRTGAMSFHISAKDLTKAVRTLNQIIKPNYKDTGMEGDRFARITYDGYGTVHLYSGMFDHAAYIPLSNGEGTNFTGSWEAIVPRAYLTDTVKAIGSKGTVQVGDTGWRHDGFVYAYPEPWTEDVHERAQRFFDSVNWEVGSEELVLPVAAFRDAVKRVAPAVSTDGVVLVLGGILLQVEDDGTVFVVATDRFRLHVDRVAAVTTFEPGSKILIDGDALARLSKQLVGEHVILHVQDTSVLVTSDGLTAVLPIVDKQFVKWERLLEGTGTDVIRVPGNQFLGTVKKLVAKKSNGKNLAATPVRLKVDRDKMLAANPDMVAPAVTVDSGVQWKTSINGRYLLDVLGCFGDAVYMWVHDEAHKPILFTGSDEFQALVMPRRVADEIVATYWDDM